jgi:hypothetical protein
MPQYTLKDGSNTTDRRLDRIPAFDRRSLDFLIRDALDDTQKQTLLTKLWDAPPDTPVLDQGQEGACTGFGTTNELLWNPVPVPQLDGTFAREKIYWVAQEDDPWPGGSYPGATPHYEGTAVLYAIKAAAAIGYYTAYHWATTETEMAQGVSHLGPAIIGINWTENMFDPDADNYVHPTGELAGGHCLLAIGLDVAGGYYTLHNSWGPTWGDNGNCKIKRADMAKLLRDQGECCIITGRSLPPPTKVEVAEKAEEILAEGSEQ